MDAMHIDSCRRTRGGVCECFKDCNFGLAGAIRESPAGGWVLPCLLRSFALPSFLRSTRWIPYVRNQTCSKVDGDMNSIGRSWGRFSLLALLLVATVGLLRVRDQEEVLP